MRDDRGTIRGSAKLRWYTEEVFVGEKDEDGVSRYKRKVGTPRWVIQPGREGVVGVWPLCDTREKIKNDETENLRPLNQAHSPTWRRRVASRSFTRRRSYIQTLILPTCSSLPPHLLIAR